MACLIAMCIVVATVLIQPTLSGAEKKPNIILFLLDDLGWRDTGSQGAEYDTPTIDRLAQEGIRLKQNYIQALCTPSRAALMSGRYPYYVGLAHGVILNGQPYGLGLEETIFPQLLKDGGYATHAVGKWNLGVHEWSYTPTYRGFDTFYGFYGAGEDYYTHIVERPYTNPDNPNETLIASGVDLHDNEDPITDEDGSYNTDLFTHAIQKAIRNHDANEGPFFIYGAYSTPHFPLQVPEHYLRRCTTIADDNRRIFCGMIQALDEGINNITMTLESNGYLNNTVIIFTTDNGGSPDDGSSNWPLRGSKGTMFEGGLRAFSFVWGNMLPRTNYDNAELMHVTDWYRTIVEGIAGLDVTADLDGYNMWQTITENRPSRRSEILLQLDPPNYSDPELPFIGQAAMRCGEWKLIIGKPDCDTRFIGCPTGWVHENWTLEESPANPARTWLFNVTADPEERNDLAESHPEIVALLRAKIEAHNASQLVQTGVPFDPRADPKFHGGVWVPWLPSSGCESADDVTCEIEGTSSTLVIHPVVYSIVFFLYIAINCITTLY